jgi:16S rRNA (adenine1518-N6/adenine1519-N6)-dimethyltransferase
VTHSRTAVTQLLEANGIVPSRALGQNFVVDPNTVRRIARLADVGGGQPVVEIGAGLGSLTLALHEAGAKVTAVEIDRHLAPILRAQVEPLGVRVVEADAMTLDWATLLADAPVWRLVANLPYNIATPLVADLLDHVPSMEQMLVMVQAEVGERFTAKPRTKAYGAVTVKIAYWAEAALVGMVSPSVFLPRPNVDSALVRIQRRAKPAVDPSLVPHGELFDLVRAGFGKRRKMLRGSLAGMIEADDFANAAIEPTARAEELDVHAWGRLAIARHKRINSQTGSAG